MPASTDAAARLAAAEADIRIAAEHVLEARRGLAVWGDSYIDPELADQVDVRAAIDRIERAHKLLREIAPAQEQRLL